MKYSVLKHLSIFSPVWARIAIPIAVSVILFSATIFLVHLPEVYNSLLQKRKEGLRDATQIVIEMIRFYHNLSKDGTFPREKAQKMVLDNIENIRFGEGGKDYFWVNDLTPVMILHPYVKELNGQDVSEYKDPNGKRLFVEMVEKSMLTGSAYVEYSWQWQDDINLVVPKISYVERFEPWGWVVGTGIYLRDIAQEARYQARQMLRTSMMILAVVALLSLLSVWQGVKAARKIRDDQATLQGIFDQTREFLCILGLDGKIHKVNKSALELAGGQREGIENVFFWESVWWQRMAEDQKIVRIAMEKAVRGENSVFDICQVLNDGKEFFLNISIQSVKDEKGRPVMILAVGQDITERIKTQKKLEQLNKDLEARVSERTRDLEKSLISLQKTQALLVESEKMAALGGLVAGVAHEINTPLGLGVTNATFLEEEMEKIRVSYDEGRFTKGEFETFLETGKEAINSMLLNLRRGAAIIGSFKKVAVDQEVEELRSFNLKEYLDEVLLSIRPKYKHTGHEIDLHCPPDLMVRSYPGILMQILSNLLMNSLIHGFDGVENGRIEISAQASGDRLVLSYSDNGVGMNREQKNKIYDPFYTTRKGRGGTGLGMHIVFNLVYQKLCGSIALETSPGNGALFTLNIPLDHPGESCKFEEI